MGERSGRVSSSDRARFGARASFGRREVWLPTAAESAALDRRAIEKVGAPSAVLMENAGRSAAMVLDRLFPDGPVVVVAGGGHNGGDGVVLARTLAAQGRPVRVLVLGDRPQPDPLTHGWPIATDPIPESDEEFAGVVAGGSVVVDALLGTGLRGAPRDPQARVIGVVNDVASRVFALDTPSGVDGSTGRVPGAAIQADVTVAFGFPKLGTIRHPGRAHAGRLIVVEIGFPPVDGASMGARLITPEWAHEHRPRRALSTHKRAEGRLLVLAGSPGMAGAAVLAARGALHAGAGYVLVASSPENRAVLQATVPEALFVDASDADALLRAVGECDALAAGPGMGTDEAAAERLAASLAFPDLKGVLLDADALTLLGEGRVPPFADAPSPARRLLTPHPGEMARLGADSDDIRDRPLEVCRDGAARWSSALLLKGTPSLVSGVASRSVWVSSTGSSQFARAGMGDVLTGVAGAFLARGADGVTAAALALHFTGRSADLAGGGDALLPSDVAHALGSAFTETAPPVSDLALPFVTLDLEPPH